MLRSGVGAGRRTIWGVSRRLGSRLAPVVALEVLPLVVPPLPALPAPVVAPPRPLPLPLVPPARPLPLVPPLLPLEMLPLVPLVLRD